MTTETLRDMLLWCFIINAGFLLYWFVMFWLAHDWIYRLHGRWFKMSVETFDAIHFTGMAIYKLGFIMLNLVPYLALLIVS